MFTARKELWILFLLISIVSCKKDNGLVDFKLKYDTAFSFNPGTPISLPFEVLTPPVTTNSQAELEGRNSELKLINYVKLEKLVMNIVNPQGKTFSFLKDINIYISADGMDDKLIASKVNIEDNIGGVLELSTTGENLKDYIKQPEFGIKVKATTDETITQTIDINIRTEYAVNAGLR